METPPVVLKPNVLDPSCPSRQLLNLILNKWTPLVIYVLHNEPRHFNELRREIGEVTQKMLTQTLRSLEAEGFVSRTVYPTSPPTVEYALTPLGKSAVTPLATIFEWAETHFPEMTSFKT